MLAWEPRAEKAQELCPIQKDWLQQVMERLEKSFRHALGYPEWHLLNAPARVTKYTMSGTTDTAERTGRTDGATGKCRKLPEPEQGLTASE